MHSFSLSVAIQANPRHCERTKQSSPLLHDIYVTVVLRATKDEDKPGLLRALAMTGERGFFDTPVTSNV